MKKWIKAFKACWIALFVVTASLANTAPSIPSVNLLTWWGYLDYPEIVSRAEKECGVKISFDEYFSNDEFLRRWKSQKNSYDIIIFSQIIYNSIKNEVNHINNSTLWKQSADYHPVIKEHYIKSHYPHNIVFFTHALTGFLYNPSIITLTSQDSVSSMFKKAIENYVAIIDDPAEAKILIESDLEDKEKPRALKIENFERQIQNAKVYITNDYSKLYQSPKFAFSFTWSGEAFVDKIEAHKNYPFLIHPKLSYISSDLLAQTLDNPASFCVANFLTSQKTLSILQNKDYYFSSYANNDNVSNHEFKKIYGDFLNYLPSLIWIDSMNENDFEKTNQAWQLIKLALNKKLREN